MPFVDMRPLTQDEIRAVNALTIELEAKSKAELVSMYQAALPLTWSAKAVHTWRKEEVAKAVAEFQLGVHWTQLPAVSRETTEITEP